MVAARHEEEVDVNRDVWQRKPLLRDAYASLYRRVDALIDRSLQKPAIEIGSGIASLGESVQRVLMTDSFVRSWLDLSLDAYALPFRDGTLGNIVAVDVFHHLARPQPMLQEAARALARGGRLILLEPYISAAGWLIYGLLHDEPVAMRQPIDWAAQRSDNRYYTAQGNATRLFFRGESRERWSDAWSLVHASRFSSFEYVLSGGFSRPAFYPRAAAPLIRRFDDLLSHCPSIFAARCIVALQKK